MKLVGFFISLVLFKKYIFISEIVLKGSESLVISKSKIIIQMKYKCLFLKVQNGVLMSTVDSSTHSDAKIRLFPSSSPAIFNAGSSVSKRGSM